MTRRGFMGRLAAAAGVAAILPGVKATMPVGDAIVAGVDIGSQPGAWMAWASNSATIRQFDFTRKFDGGIKETDEEFTDRYQRFLGDLEFDQAVTGNAIFKIHGRTT